MLVSAAAHQQKHGLYWKSRRRRRRKSRAHLNFQAFRVDGFFVGEDPRGLKKSSFSPRLLHRRCTDIHGLVIFSFKCIRKSDTLCFFSLAN